VQDDDERQAAAAGHGVKEGVKGVEPALRCRRS
jgi:hypothetical protein